MDPNEPGSTEPEQVPEQDESHEGWAQEPSLPPLEPQASTGRGIVVTIAIALIVSLAGNVLLGTRLRDERIAIADLRERDRQLQNDLDALRGSVRNAGTDALSNIASAVERLRGLDFKTDVEPELLSPAAFKERVRKEISGESDAAEARATQKVLVLLGVIPAGYDLAKETLAIEQEQVAGFYDNRSKKLVVPAADARNPSPLDQEVLAHEYTHALTDQYYDLGRLDRLREEKKDDEGAAYLALAEGDAEAVRTLYDSKVLTADERARVGEQAREIDTEKFAAAPRFLQEAYLFPYTEGVGFVEVLRDAGGFAQVNKAYADPPRSTEQILHPDKYLDERDDPVSVSIPDLRDDLGSGWKELDGGEVGEFDLRLIAEHGGEGVSTRKANAAAGGWDGGEYVALESAGRTVLAISTAWDSDSEANEANRLFGEWVPARFRNQGSSFDVGADGSGWEAASGAGAVFRDGAHVVIVLGPNREIVERARAGFRS